MKRKTIGQIAAIMLSAALLSGCGEQASEQAETSAEVTTAAETTTETTIETTTETTTAETTTTASTTTQATTHTTTAPPVTTEAVTTAATEKQYYKIAIFDCCSMYFDGADIVSYNADGSANVVVKLHFYNKSGENKIPAYVFDVQMFQDGIECDKAYLSYDEKKKYDTSAAYKEVQTEHSIDIYEAFTTYNTESDVFVQIKGFWDFSDEILAANTYNF